MSVWNSSDLSEWLDLDRNYDTIVENLGKEKLIGLEKWYQDELPELIKKQKKLRKDDLVKLVEWKLTRGKWRPRLLDFAKQADAGAVEDASLRAFNLVLKIEPNKPCPLTTFKQALSALTELKGVGPATASAALSAAHSSIPFMSDEALTAALGSRDYTVSAAVNLTVEIQKKAKELTEQAGSDHRWTARRVEKAVFAAAAREKQGNDKAKKAVAKDTKKRKR